tara:strand:+ start:1174 stop:2046 length:873 start_codon:yes stop_codon:yes gene_type:complete
MASFESTIDNPLGFLKYYLAKNGEFYLREKFESFSQYDYYYNKEDDCIHSIDLETNKIQYVVSFPEFVKSEFRKELRIAKNFIFQKSRLNGKDQDAKLYALILIDCLEMQRYVDAAESLNFRDEINQFVRSSLTYVFRKFERFYPRTPELKRVKEYFQKRGNSNVTGFKLLSQVRNSPLRDIFSRMQDEGFISRRSRFASFEEFFKGEKPRFTLSWEKKPHELWYFIDRLTKSGTLENPPGQKWRHMNSIFTYQGNKLPDNWPRNNNKLQNQAKKEAIDRIIRMFQPRQE